MSGSEQPGQRTCSGVEMPFYLHQPKGGQSDAMISTVGRSSKAWGNNLGAGRQTAFAGAGWAPALCVHANEMRELETPGMLIVQMVCS